MGRRYCQMLLFNISCMSFIIKCHYIILRPCEAIGRITYSKEHCLASPRVSVFIQHETDEYQCTQKINLSMWKMFVIFAVQWKERSIHKYLKLWLDSKPINYIKTKYKLLRHYEGEIYHRYILYNTAFKIIDSSVIMKVYEE